MRVLLSLMYCDGDIQMAASNGYDIWLKRRLGSSHGVGHILSCAVLHGHSECVRVILPYYRAFSGDYLHDSIEYGHPEILKILLEAGLEVDGGRRGYSGLLKQSTKKNNGAMVTILLEHNQDKCFPSRAWEITKAALKHRAYAAIRAFHTFEPKWGDVFLEDAIKNNNYEISKFLIEDEYTLTLDVDRAFELACEHGNYHAMISLYYHRRPDINANNGAPLLKAAKGGHPMVVEFLLKKGADPTALPEPYRLLYLRE